MDYEVEVSTRVAHIMLAHLGRSDDRAISQPDGSATFEMGHSEVRVGAHRVNDWAHVDVSVVYWDVDPMTGEETEIGDEQCFYSIDDYGHCDWAQIGEIARNL